MRSGFDSIFWRLLMRRVMVAFTTLGISIMAGCASVPLMGSSVPESVTVRISGRGESFANAQDNALRNAVALVYGALTITERSISDNQLSETNLSYSRGMVEDFKVTSHWIDAYDGLHNVELLATVSAATLGKRILYSSDPKAVDGSEISRRIEMGRIQAHTERLRYQQAEKLFRHILYEVPSSLFDVTVRDVRTARSGATIQTNVMLHVELNAKVLDSLCRASQFYSASMQEEGGLHPAVEVERGYWLRINGACAFFTSLHNSVTTLMDKDDFERTISGIKRRGVCVSLLDNNGIRIGGFFHFAHLMRDGYQGSGGSRYPAVGAQNYYGAVITDKGRMTSQPIIELTRKNWGNAQELELEIPSDLEHLFSRLASIQARVTLPANCN